MIKRTNAIITGRWDYSIEIQDIYRKISGTELERQSNSKRDIKKLYYTFFVNVTIFLFNHSAEIFVINYICTVSLKKQIVITFHNFFQIVFQKLCDFFILLVSPEKLKKPIKLLESPPRGRALFPRTKWDEALQEGEYEVFIPSKKYLKRMQKLVKRKRQIDSQVLVTPSQNNQVKSRRSLDPSLIKNPFSTPSNSNKKVKINTKLNRSQEIYEHHMQILRSPEIPHDPNKKPVKPVLKSPARTNSINPFYDKQLSIW